MGHSPCHGHGPPSRPRAKRRLAVRRLEPGTASNYIRHLPALLKAGLVSCVVLYCRVSGWAQFRRGNAEDQEAYLRQLLEPLGIEVVEVFKEVGPGWDLCRSQISEAIASARKHGAVVLAESPDRFLRSEHFHSKENQDALPTEAQFEELGRLADGVVLATYLPPDATPAEVRSYQRKRGQQIKNRKGGRPPKEQPGYKTRRREEWLPTVLRLHAKGMSQRGIHRRTKVARTTIQRWLQDDADRVARFSAGDADQTHEKAHENRPKDAKPQPPRRRGNH
jgi:DNA invertase Pin-like site-specific DNA recombinase